jgi:hypothetical protein
MLPLNYQVLETLGKGLRPSKRNPRNQPFLVESIGAVPREKVIQAIDEFSLLNTITIMGALTFPYPQLFVLDEFVLACSSSAIFELVSGTLTSRISGLSVGQRWSCIDFKSYIGLTNGVISVVRNPTTTLWSSTVTEYGTSVCNFNGQVLLGGFGKQAVGVI